MPRTDAEWVAAAETNDEGCRLWAGSTDLNGYGRIRRGGRERKAHIYFYELEVGPVPDGRQLGHECHDRSECPGGKCYHRRCFEPSHMAPQTPLENTRAGRGANALKTHCPADHEYTPENTLHSQNAKGPYRRCRICTLASNAKSRG